MKRAVIIGSSESYHSEPNGGNFAVPAPPLSILAVGSYLAAHGVPVELIDIEMDFGVGLDRGARAAVAQRVARYLRERAEDIAWIGISLHSNLSLSMCEDNSPIGEIRAALPDTPMILGGYFASIDYHVLLEQYPFVTAVVRGNGEAPALEISRSLAEGRPLLLDQTPNLAWVENGEIRTTPIQSLPLDDLPILDFRLLRNSRCYQKIDLLTSRGCPFSCDYCLERLMRPYGAYPLDWVTRQLEHVEEVLPNRRLFVFDPIFGVQRERTLEICKALTGRGFSWGFLGRADVLPDDLLPPLHAAGVETVFLGIEAVSTPALLRMNKVRSAAMAEDYVKKALDVIKACFENNVTPFIGIMLGYPGDEESDYQAAIAFFDQVQRLHEHSAARPGLYVHPMVTKIYDNSALAERAKKDFPDAVFKAGPLVGETFVTSSTLDPDTIQSYAGRIAQKFIATPTALERLHDFWMRPGNSLESFLDAHPALLDDQGVFELPEAICCDDFPA